MDHAGTGTRAEHAALLASLVDIYAPIVDPRTAFASTSPAAAEIHGARQHRTHVGTWGEQPVLMAYELAVISYRAALDLATALSLLMAGEVSVVPLGVVTRSLAEIASQAWWLLEPTIGYEQRVRRLLAVRFRSAVEGEKVAKDDGATEDALSRYAETKASVTDHAIALGLDPPQWDGRVASCGSARAPSPSRRVPQMFKVVDVPSVYRITSAFPHGEVFGLWQAFEMPVSELFLGEIDRADVAAVCTAVAAWSLQGPAHRLALLLGLGVPSEDAAR